MSLEEIELIPENRFRGRMVKGKVVVDNSYDRTRKWNNNARHILYKRIKNIVRNSVGQKWDDVYSKLCKMTKDISYENELDYWTSDIIRPYWNIQEKRWYGVRWRSYHFDLFQQVKSLKSITVYGHYSFHEMHWICPYTGILRYVRVRKPPPPSKEQIRSGYEKQAQRRRSRKQDRKERRLRGLPQLAMINRPDLYGFYNKLVFRYKALQTEMWKDRVEGPPRYEKFTRYYSMKLKKMINEPIKDPKATYLRRYKLWKSMNEWRKERVKEIKEEMATIEPQIEALEQGRYNIFFESNVYLYSQQKECHHFEQP